MMIKKLVNLLKNYDKIMLMIEQYDKKPKKGKRHSVLNTPKSQLELIEKMKEGK